MLNISKLLTVKLPRPWKIAVLMFSCLLQQKSTAQSRQPIDVSKLGPQTGERVPDLTLRDQTGKIWTLQSLMGPKGLMLVFFRSADW